MTGIHHAIVVLWSLSPRSQARTRLVSEPLNAQLQEQRMTCQSNECRREGRLAPERAAIDLFLTISSYSTD